jgi:hypothetical protein
MHLDHLADRLRVLGRRLQTTSDYRDRFHDRAEDVERGDGMIEASLVDQGGGRCKCVPGVFGRKRSRRM